MKTSSLLRSMLLFGAVSFMACQEVTLDRHTVLLVDSNGDGYASSGACGVEPAVLADGCEGGDPTEPADDCVIFPNPDGCAMIAWSEEHSTVTDENGNIIEETWTTCTQCLAADGSPIGEEECTTGGVVDPVVCYTVDSGDPTVSCWECSSPDGELLYGGCDPLPVYCASDAECPDGQLCQLFPTFDCDPNAEVCPMMPEFIADGVCTIPVQGCYSDFDCAPGEYCQLNDFECPPGAACPDVMTGTCTPGNVGGCEVNGDEQSCAASGCEWVGADPACLGGPSGEGCPGYCTEPQANGCSDDSQCAAGEICELYAIDCPPGMFCPAVMEGICVPAPTPDECAQNADEASCSANPACGWFAFGMPCIEGEPCVSGVCQSLGGGCGDGVILPAP